MAERLFEENVAVVGNLSIGRTDVTSGKELDVVGDINVSGTAVIGGALTFGGGAALAKILKGAATTQATANVTKATTLVVNVPCTGAAASAFCVPAISAALTGGLTMHAFVQTAGAVNVSIVNGGSTDITQNQIVVNAIAVS